MYIAFKWLLGLTIVMWMAMCCIDVFVKKNSYAADEEGVQAMPTMLSSVKNNRTVRHPHKNYKSKRVDAPSGTSFWHCCMFVAGALVVTIYNSIHKIKQELTRVMKENIQQYLRVTAIETRKIAIKLYDKILAYLKIAVNKWKDADYALNLRNFFDQTMNYSLLKKIEEISDQRNTLMQLLNAAIADNKNITVQFQLEHMAKKRLLQHIESIQHAIKENKSKYVNFQQMYLVTHQENSFLKFRLKKLTKEKEAAEKNLLELLNEVYKSKNYELKAYCSRFIVKTKDNLLNADVGSEIRSFMRKSQTPNSEIVKCWKEPAQPSDLEGNWIKQTGSACKITEVMKNNSDIEIINCDVPKLKGLPGEYVWTVKDKDGIIEKLYEYDFESEESGDTIRRIRQYSVYYDKDCLLDFANSSTYVTVNTARPDVSFTRRACAMSSQRFLTGSEAFQKFILNNKNLVSTSLIPMPSNNIPNNVVQCVVK